MGVKKEDGLDDEARGKVGTSINEILKEVRNEGMTPETLLSVVKEALMQCKEGKTKGGERKIKEEQEEVGKKMEVVNLTGSDDEERGGKERMTIKEHAKVKIEQGATGRSRVL